MPFPPAGDPPTDPFGALEYHYQRRPLAYLQSTTSYPVPNPAAYELWWQHFSSQLYVPPSRMASLVSQSLGGNMLPLTVAPSEPLPIGVASLPAYVIRYEQPSTVDTPVNQTLLLPQVVEAPFLTRVDPLPNRGLLGRLLEVSSNLLATTLSVEAPFFTRLEVLRFRLPLRQSPFDFPNLLLTTLNPTTTPFAPTISQPSVRLRLEQPSNVANLLATVLGEVETPFSTRLDILRSRPIRLNLSFEPVNLLLTTLSPAEFPLIPSMLVMPNRVFSKVHLDMVQPNSLILVPSGPMPTRVQYGLRRI